MRHEWREEADLSVHFSRAVFLAFCYHTLVHIFGQYVVVTAPDGLILTKRTYFGLSSCDILLIASILLFIWAVCHAPMLRSRRWKLHHRLSLAILLLCTAGTVCYSVVLWKMDQRFRQPIATESRLLETRGCGMCALLDSPPDAPYPQ